MTGFDAELAALEEAAHDVRRAAARLRSDRDEVDHTVRGFLGAGWTGRAAESFSDAWLDWRRGAADVLDGLDAMAALLAATRTTYSDVDSSAQGHLHRIAGHLVERLG
jgi:WXG100 family type VII secretion target